MRSLLVTSLIAMVAATPILAQTCEIDIDAVDARIADLERNYSGVLSDIGCDAPTIPAHQIMCDASDQPNAQLWRMGRLDTLAWVYAVENATGQQVDQENPPLDEDFIARRDACTDAACLCDVLISHTNDSLGGTSPYPQ
ncbi:hypothetical protein [Tabrizicola sp.]|uniref:hypothetical protein n=1 Tax=Tabrizicola sp. TaxID=2005166 RepID=UPI00286A5834|nr:hypothetical protein [Tabrizicola sp.]